MLSSFQIIVMVCVYLGPLFTGFWTGLVLVRSLGPNSIETIWLQFRLEKRLEIPFWFWYMPEQPTFELFLSIGNLKLILK